MSDNRFMFAQVVEGYKAWNEMRPSNDGEWVRHEDYAALEAELKALREQEPVGFYWERLDNGQPESGLLFHGEPSRDAVQSAMYASVPSKPHYVYAAPVAASAEPVVFRNDGTEPDYSHMNCPACGGSGHVDDVKAASAEVPDDLRQKVERLLEVSAYIGESQYCGEGDPWGDVRAMLAAAQKEKKPS